MARARRRYLVDDNGRRESVVLSISEYRELLEDLQDLAIMAERRDEPIEPLEGVKLEARWRNTR